VHTPGVLLHVVGSDDATRAADRPHPAAGGADRARQGADRPTDQASPHRVRIIDATLGCLARYGTAKTTVDDIARRAGVSRATVYRAFPGGRDEILSAVVDTEMARLFSALGVCLGEASNLTDALVVGIVEASSRIRNHAALAYLVANEPEVVLGHLAFDESDRLLTTASRFTAPFLARWMTPDEAGRVAEWATRIVLSYAIAPSAGTDLTDEVAARRLVTTFVIPGIEALHHAGTPEAIDITPFGHGGPDGPDVPAPFTAIRSTNTHIVKGDTP
jgi:AcrR family transcriptional regulator